MTKYVEAIENYDDLNGNIEKNKIYEVISETSCTYKIKDDVNYISAFPKDWFKEVESPTKEETKFKFIPQTEIQYATVNGVKGILIKE